jgi:hypothetical protein
MNFTAIRSMHPSAAAIASARIPLLIELFDRHAPEVPTALKQLAAIEQAAAKIPEPDPNEGSEVVWAALENGTLDELDLVDTYRKASTAGPAYMQTAEQLSRIVSSLCSHIEVQVGRAAPAIAAELAARVTAAVARLRTHPVTARNITSAHDAADAGMTDEWAAYTQLRQDYAAAYAALELLIRADALGDRTAWHANGIEVRRLANPETACPNFLAIRAGEMGSHRVSWPTEPDAFLDWLIQTPDAVPAAFIPDDMPARQKAIAQAVSKWKTREQDAREERAANDPHNAMAALSLNTNGRARA